MISINKKRIRSLKNNLPSNLIDKKLVLAVNFEQNKNRAVKVGFDDNPAVGDTILPKAIGRATAFNAYGKNKILRSQPKEKVYRTQEWPHTEWRGRGETEEVTSLVDIPYYRYPRQHIDGYEHELTVTEKDGTKLIALSSGITYADDNSNQIVSAINVFLEIFGHVEVYDENLDVILSATEVRRLNWIVLPKGEKISESQLKGVLSRSKRVRPVEMLRQERIGAFKPNIIATGQGGFTGYVIYVFNAKGIAVLESIRYGNASYVLSSDNWEELSKMTKQQLLSKSLVKQREIHTKSWFDRIKKILGT